MLSQVQKGLVLLFLFMFTATSVFSAPYAAMVIDAKSGKVLHSRNADTRLHPASLTKMMTLYVVFKAIDRGELKLDSKVKISRYAAGRPPSKLGIRAGSTMKVRHLIRGTAVKSANDAATALAEAVSGSEKAFGVRMTRQARKLGMKRTTFKNPHGLTQSGHMSTARDMTILGHRLLTDFPQYYHLFSRQTADAGIKKVSNTNRRFLNGYRGADGIKTGYTRAAGFNLVASAKKGNKRVIATVFGGKSSADRYTKVARLLDLGFGTSGSSSKYKSITPKVLKAPTAKKSKKIKPKVIKAPRAVVVSLRPHKRPAQLASLEPTQSQDDIEAAIIAANLETLKAKAPVVKVQTTASLVEQEAQIIKAVAIQEETIDPEPAVLRQTEAIVVERVASRAGSKAWAVQLGAYGSRYQAEKILLRTALSDLRSLDGALRSIKPTVVKGQRLYRAQFVGISKDSAGKTCARLNARSVECQAVRSGT